MRCTNRRIPQRHRRIGTRSLRWVLAAQAALTGTLAGGCSDLFNVDAPGVIQLEDMASPLGAATLRAGAITRFVEGFIGTEGDAGVVGMTAGLADEFTAANRSARGRYVMFDQRATRDPDGVPYVALQTARINLLEAIEALQLHRPEPQRDIGELFGLLAYIELFLAEGDRKSVV